jgi:hypothetical protein
MLTVDDQLDALATAAIHLEPDGLLALDIFNPDLAMLADDDPTPFHIRDVPRGNNGHHWSITGRNSWNHAAQVNHARVDLADVRSSGTVARRLRREFDMRYTFRHEMEHLLRLSGFTPESVYGNFKGGPLRPQSDDMVWIARRATGRVRR